MVKALNMWISENGANLKSSELLRDRRSSSTLEVYGPGTVLLSSIWGLHSRGVDSTLNPMDTSANTPEPASNSGHPDDQILPLD